MESNISSRPRNYFLPIRRMIWWSHAAAAMITFVDGFGRSRRMWTWGMPDEDFIQFPKT